MHIKDINTTIIPRTCVSYWHHPTYFFPSIHVIIKQSNNQSNKLSSLTSHKYTSAMLNTFYHQTLILFNYTSKTPLAYSTQDNTSSQKSEHINKTFKSQILAFHSRTTFASKPQPRASITTPKTTNREESKLTYQFHFQSVQTKALLKSNL